METPHRNVRFASNPDLLSPMSDASSVALEPTSSLLYINSQLVAHGFVPSPGISLDGISVSDSQRVVKCLLALLGQRVEDMARTEDLSTKLRTLSYDHERLQTMHKTTNDTLANAQRDVNLQKNRLKGVNRNLQNLENNHKQTVTELQRTRSTMQALRFTHQAEQKRRDKEMDRMTERWSKISDSQAKLSATRSGVRCANFSAVEGSGFKGSGDSDPLFIGLRETEKACAILRRDNSRLKDLSLSSINELQSIYFDTRFILGEVTEQPIPFNLQTLFPPGFTRHAEDKLAALSSGMHDILWQLPSASPKPGSPPPQRERQEVSRLTAVVKSLQTQLEESQNQAQSHVYEKETLSKKFAEERQAMHKDVQVTNQVRQEQQRATMTGLQDQLGKEQQRFAEVVRQLEKDKLDLETEKTQFLEEKANWETEKMSSYLPPTPGCSSQTEQLQDEEEPSLRKSGRRHRKSSQLQISVGKVKSPHKRPKHKGLIGSSKNDAPYETEYMPPVSLGLKPLGNTLLPSSFSLPPVSPLLSQPCSPEISPDLKPGLPPLPPPPSSSSSSLLLASPEKAYPTAKQRSSRMVHAYSPARPSPLSRILLLGNSPNVGTPLEALIEEELNAEVDSGGIDDIFPPMKIKHRSDPVPGPSLAQELGVSEDSSESEQDSPLRGKMPPSRKASSNNRQPQQITRKPVPNNNNKGKARMVTSGNVRAAVVEKENGATVKKKRPEINANNKRGVGVGVTGTSSSGSSQTKKMTMSMPSSQHKVVGKVSVPAKGPRRIPVNSLEAPVNARR